jgi:threonine/homoserine/homoserine lactone efflux protein
LALSLIYQTFIIVLLLTFSFGPAFFALINTGIRYGYKTGSLLAFGVVLSDFFVCVLMIFLVHYGATNFIQDEKSQRFMGVVAGIILIVFGVLHFKEPIEKGKETTLDIKIPSPKIMIFKGFFLNCLNPAVWLLWLGNVTAVGKTLSYSIINMIIYFGITLGLVLLVELGKVSAANKLKQVLTQKTMRTINIITGTLLMMFGLILIYNHFFNL